MSGIVGRVQIDVAPIKAVLSEAKKRNIAIKGARAAGRILLRAARAQAPKRSGATRRAQGVKAAKGRKGQTLAYAVQGVKTKFQLVWTPKGGKKPQKVVPAFIDHLIQLGTRPHSLAKGARLSRVRGKRTSAAVGQDSGRLHPGARPNPYRERAWVSVKRQAGEECVKAMAEATQKEIDRAAARLAAKLAKG